MARISNVALQKGTTEELNEIGILDGQILFDTTKHRIYLDDTSERIIYAGNEELTTDKLIVNKSVSNADKNGNIAFSIQKGKSIDDLITTLGTKFVDEANTNKQLLESINNLNKLLGSTNNLATANKSSLVEAINELTRKVNSMSFGVKRSQNVYGSITLGRHESGTMVLGLSGFTNANKMMITHLEVQHAGIGIYLEGNPTWNTGALYVPVYNSWGDGSSTLTLSAGVVEFT